MLAENPPWRSRFFAYLPNGVSDARTPLELLLSIKGTKTPPSMDDLRSYLDFLVQRNFDELAYYAWLQFLPPEQLARVGRLFNGDFEMPLSGLPFDWRFKGGSGVTIEITDRPDYDGGKALLLEFGPGRVELGGVSQIVLLPPGRYQLEGKYKSDLVSQRGLQWRVSCGDKLLGESRPVTGTEAGLGRLRRSLLGARRLRCADAHACIGCALGLRDLRVRLHLVRQPQDCGRPGQRRDLLRWVVTANGARTPKRDMMIYPVALRSLLFRMRRWPLRIQRASTATAVALVEDRDCRILLLEEPDRLRLPALPLNGWLSIHEQVDAWLDDLIADASPVSLVTAEGSCGAMAFIFRADYRGLTPTEGLWLSREEAERRLAPPDARFLELSAKAMLSPRATAAGALNPRPA